MSTALQRRVARHEAAHVLARHLLGLATPHRVAVLVRESDSAVAGETAHLAALTPTDPDGWEREIVALLAGPALDRLNEERPVQGAGDHDRERAREMARLLDKDDPDVVVTRCDRRAAELVDDHAPAIGRLAGTLLANGGSIAGTLEVALAVRAALEDLPEPRLDAGGVLDFLARRRARFERASAERPDLTDAECAELWDLSERAALGGEDRIRRWLDTVDVRRSLAEPATTPSAGWWSAGTYGAEAARIDTERAERRAAVDEYLASRPIVIRSDAPTPRASRARRARVSLLNRRLRS